MWKNQQVGDFFTHFFQCFSLVDTYDVFFFLARELTGSSDEKSEKNKEKEEKILKELQAAMKEPIEIEPEEVNFRFKENDEVEPATLVQLIDKVQSKLRYHKRKSLCLYKDLGELIYYFKQTCNSDKEFAEIMNKVVEYDIDYCRFFVKWYLFTTSNPKLLNVNKGISFMKVNMRTIESLCSSSNKYFK